MNREKALISCELDQERQLRTPAFLVKEKLGVKMPQVTGKHVRVLAVDDSPAFLNTLCTFLEDDPTYEIVATAQNGEEALSAVERWHPQVVLMDLQMPKMNGLEATVELHQHYPDLTVIILTAHDLPTLRDACIQHGAYGFVTKAQLGRQLPALLANAPVPQED